MLHTETVEKGTLDLIKTLMNDSKFNDFNLVGGTALSLQIGHRKSIDIDLFSTSPFNSQQIADYLALKYRAKDVNRLNNAVFCFIENIKVDILSHQYPLVKNVSVVDDIRLISLEDIGAMKLNAIYNNGSRLKDFVDLYALLEKLSLADMLNAFQKKYPDINIEMAKQAVIYFDDIDFSMPIMHIGGKVDWKDISQRLCDARNNQHLSFGIPSTTKKLLNDIEAAKVKKGRRPKP